VAHADRAVVYLFEYLEIFHDRSRRHSSLRMLVPVGYADLRRRSVNVAWLSCSGSSRQRPSHLISKSWCQQLESNPRRREPDGSSDRLAVGRGRAQPGVPWAAPKDFFRAPLEVDWPHRGRVRVGRRAYCHTGDGRVSSGMLRGARGPRFQSPPRARPAAAEFRLLCEVGECRLPAATPLPIPHRNGIAVRGQTRTRVPAGIP